ncbi:DUF2062 domain-containing protein [Paenibacillus sp. y28]
MKRYIKFKYLMLLRAKGGASMVAAGFSIGIAVEMFTLPTFGAAFLLLFPFVRLFRASMEGALIGFVAGKLVYSMFAFPNARLGRMLLGHKLEPIIDHISFLPHKLLSFYSQLLVGGIINGLLLGLLLYFPIRWFLQYMLTRRLQRRKERKALRVVMH